MKPTIRDPIAAGTFYPADATRLRAELGALLAAATVPGTVPMRLIVAPHASLARCGAVIAAAHASAIVPPLVVVLAPNHHGAGAALACPRVGRWRTPLGLMEIDTAAADRLLASSAFRDDWRAHARDHSVEVQLPFVQVGASRQEREPPKLLTLACKDLEVAELLAAGEALARALADDEALLVVSADLTLSRAEDGALLERVAACDAEGVAQRIRSRGLVTCALAPLAIGLAAARRLGGAGGEVVARSSSEDGETGHAAVALRR